MGDIPFLGDLTNLEILSFSYCRIQKLPSTIGKLKRLKVLDVTGCADLSIDDAVFGHLDKLEELYLRSCGSEGVGFTATNRDELKIRSLQLSTLEAEFFYKNMLQGKDLSYEKLKKFKISMGCEMDIYKFKYNSGNILKLVSNCSEVVECKMNELFEKTETLYLEVKDMQNIEQVSLGYYSFSNLKDLQVSECADLTFLFAVEAASGLTKLEYLRVFSCPVLETLIHGESTKGRDGRVIKFPKLKFLYLDDLPRLVSLCDTDNIRVELHQLVELKLGGLPKIISIFADDAMQYSFFNQRIQIPNMETLMINYMEKLVQIWPAASSEIITTATRSGSRNEKEEEVINNNVSTCSMLSEIFVSGCDSLENLFPHNPLPLLNHLELLYVSRCYSIKVLFNIDLAVGAGAGNINEHTSSLRHISVRNLEHVREIWRIKEAAAAGGSNNNSSSSALLVRCFQAVEKITIEDCPRFRDVFAPKSINFDIRARLQIDEDIIKATEERTGISSASQMFDTDPFPAMMHPEQVLVLLPVLFKEKMYHQQRPMILPNPFQ